MRSFGLNAWIGPLVAVAIGALGVLGYQEFQRLDEATLAATRSRDVMLSLRSITEAVADAEAGQRGFLLAADAGSRERYRAATRTIDARLQTLATETADDPVQAQAGARLRVVAAGLEDLWDREMEHRARGDLGPRFADENDRARQPQSADAWRLTAQMMAHEEGRLMRERAAVTAARRATEATALLAIGLLLLCSVGVSVILRRGRRREAAADRALAEANARLVTITDHIPMMIAYVDADERMRFANRESRQAVGRPGTYVGLTLREFVGEAMYAGSEPWVKRALAGERVSFEAEMQLGGRLQRHEVSYVPDKDANGHVRGFYGVRYNITARAQLEAELRRTQAHLEAILNHVPALIAFWDTDGRARFINATHEAYFGLPVEAMNKMAMRDLLGEEAYRASQPYLRAALAGVPQQFERSARRADGRIFHGQVSYVPKVRDGEVQGIYVLTSDVTRLHELQSDLEQSEARFRELSLAADVGIFVTDAGGRCTFTNPAWRRIVGVGPDDDPDTAWHAALDPAARRPAIDYWLETVRADGRPQAAKTFRMQRPDGSFRWVRCRGVALPAPDGQRRRYLATCEDITELNKSYDRIRELAQRLETVREDERRGVALTLHEGVSQNLYAAKLSVDYLRTQLRGSAGADEVAEELARNLESCLDELRGLTNELRPTALAHLRLSLAIAQHGQEIAERSGLRITVTETPQFPDLSEVTRVALFRAAQEALGNVVRHARATNVEVVLSATDGAIAVTISDDGVGIDAGDAAKSGCLGLLGIQELLAARGGAVTVQRARTQGTVVTCTLPLPPGRTESLTAARRSALH